MEIPKEFFLIRLGVKYKRVKVLSLNYSTTKNSHRCKYSSKIKFNKFVTIISFNEKRFILF